MLSQLNIVYSIPFPTFYSGLLRWMGLIELDLPQILPLGCIVNFSFYSALLLRTLLLPVLGLVFMAIRTLQNDRFHLPRPLHRLPLRVSQKVIDVLGGALPL